MRTATETLDAAFGDGIVVAGVEASGVGARGAQGRHGGSGPEHAGGFTAGGFRRGEFAFDTAWLHDGFGGDDARGRRGD